MSLEKYLIENMEDAMSPYLTSEAYLAQTSAVNQQIAEFRDGLSDTQKALFNKLIDKMTDERADFYENAYLAGVKTGMELKEELSALEE